ncbi:GNAT family N-acetyltransferase [Maribacter sp.]|uniref:GNAT family N-acetyltransferase n=1 Tax=Maribacter sp. TaxID=1897614 RepID=UPI0025B7B1FF|nr:GNAT family N-acetyltransferase [Maribacter sp.]
MLEIKTKTFQEFTTEELYKILQLRSEVFVLEQDCVYQDIDNKDQSALHIIGTKNGEIVAYTRIFAPGLYFKDASIGRVVVKQSERKYGYGKVVMEASIKAVKTHFNQIKIHISAQEYLIKFYTSLGFKQVGEGYLEDNIPHVGMVKDS